MIGSEFEAAKVTRAEQHLALAGLAEFVDIREGDATETLSRELVRIGRDRVYEDAMLSAARFLVALAG